MSSMTVKRIVVWVISMVVGFGLANLIISVGFDLLPLISSIQSPQGVSIEEYGILYFLFTAIPLGFAVLIWLDKFFGTEILKD